MLRLAPSSTQEVTQLRELYHTTKDVRVRTRSQMILLAFDGLSAPKIAKIADLDPESVRRCMLSYRNEGIAGLYDKPRTGRPRRVTTEYLQQAIDLLRRRPRSMGLSFSVWTLQRLVECLIDQTGVTVSDETLLKRYAPICISRVSLSASHNTKYPVLILSTPKKRGD